MRNGFGEVKRRTSPDSGTTDDVRDLRGLVTQMTDGRTIVTNYTYDNAARRLCLRNLLGCQNPLGRRMISQTVPRTA